MNAEIVSIGTELLLGSITDTNATYLTQELAALGINCYWVSQVGDNLERIREVLARALGRSDLVITTGGLGPTEDDLTREAIAAVLGETMVVQPELEAELRAFFAARGAAMPEQNVKQATLIPAARVLPNPVGTAPGWWVEHAGHVVVAMPGVPFEMRRMWSREAVPQLLGRRDAHLVSRTLKVLGLGESAAEEQVRDLLHLGNPTLATYAKNDGVHLRLTAQAADEAAARALIAPVEATIRGRLGDAVWGADGETLEDVVCGLLAARGQSLAVLEAGGATGGQVARLLSRATAPAPVVSALVVPQPTAPALARAGFPGVDPLGEGGVAALAAALRARQTVDLALVSAGALPGGRDDGRVECELWVALAGGAGSGDGRALVRRLPIRAARGELQRLATLQALNLLRKELLRMEGERG